MTTDVADWIRQITVIVGLSSADLPDWVEGVAFAGSGGAAYASLTGAGETVTPGKLTQAGAFEVDAGSSNIDLNTTGTGHVEINCAGSGGVIVSSSDPSGGIAMASNTDIDLSVTAANRTSAIWLRPTGNNSNILMSTGVGGEVDIAPGNVSGTGPQVIRVAASALGFFSHTPAGQPTVTGSRGGNAALASLLTSLAGLGLIVDSSTP